MMEFEFIGGNSRGSQYSLYDYSEDPFGETVMSIEVYRSTGDWWFVGKPKGEMNIEHMKALSKLLEQLISEQGEFIV